MHRQKYTLIIAHFVFYEKHLEEKNFIFVKYIDFKQIIGYYNINIIQIN